MLSAIFLFFFFNDTATTEIYTLSLHDALPIYRGNLRGANLARIVVKFEKHFEKGIHTVRAGEHDPIVSVRVLHELAECAQVGWRFNSDGGQFKNVGPERTQLIA